MADAGFSQVIRCHVLVIQSGHKTRLTIHSSFITRSTNQSQEESNRYSAFIQDTWTFKNEKNDISLTAGLRPMYLGL